MDQTFKLDFAGVGSIKAGTTWLAQCLGEHPQVCMSAIKETNFFTRSHPTDSLPDRRLYDASNYDRGLGWLAEQFRAWTPGQLRGEYSPGYLPDAECPRLLHAHNPAMKLLFSFRQPAEVLYSGYFQLQTLYAVHDDFETALEKFPHMMEYCRYHKHVERFLSVFPREQVCLLLYDDMRADPAATFASVCRFLGIDDTCAPPSLTHRVNARTVPRSVLVRDMRSAVRATLASHAVTRALWSGLQRSGVLQPLKRLYQLNEKATPAPAPMNPATRQRIDQAFAEDNLRLGALMGRDLSHWNRPA
ncbi:MAG: sulfotransferase domain-containing protein [Lentisphaerae bacterium]|nr:sulfotransferase domain-containing protein [Lentisphaerota bacterium]